MVINMFSNWGFVAASIQADIKAADPELMQQWMGLMTNPDTMKSMQSMMNPELMTQMMFAMMTMMAQMGSNTAPTGDN